MMFARSTKHDVSRTVQLMRKRRVVPISSVGAFFAFRDLDDKWLVRNAKLLDLSLAQADAYGKSLIAPLVLSLDGLSSADAQIRCATGDGAGGSGPTCRRVSSSA